MTDANQRDDKRPGPSALEAAADDAVGASRLDGTDRRSRVTRAAAAATMTLREARLELASLAAWLQR